MGAVELATAYVSIVPSTKGIKAQLDKEFGKPLVDAGDDAGAKAGKSFGDRFTKESGRSMANFGKTALVGAVAFGVGLVGVASAADGLNSALAANVQVLGESSGAVQAWAKDSVKNVGLSERAALDGATSFGQLAKSAGMTGDEVGAFSIKMVTAAADLAAFKNVPIGDALRDLQAGFAGQTEVLRKYGIFLDDSTIKAGYFAATGEHVTGVLTSQQRIIGSNNAILEQGVDIWGQADRESGSFARAQDNLKASLENAGAAIGQQVVPMVTTLVTLAGGAATKFAEWNESSGGLVGSLLTVGAAGLGTVGAMTFISGKVTEAVAAFRDLGTAAKTATVGLGLIAAAVTVWMTISAANAERQQVLNDRTQTVSTSLLTQTKQTWDLVAATDAANPSVSGLAAANSSLNAALTGSDKQGQKLTKALGALGLSTQDAVKLMQLLSNTLTKDGYLKAAGAAGDGSRELAEEFLKLHGVSADLADVLVQAGGMATDVGQVADVVTDATKDWTTEEKALFEAIKDVGEVANDTDLAEIASKTLNIAAASNASTKALVEQAEAQAGASRNGADSVRVYEELNVILAAMTDAERDAALGGFDLSAAQEKATVATADLGTVAASTLVIMSEADRALQDAATAADGLTSAFDSLIGSQIDLQAASDDWLVSVAALGKTLKKNKGSLDENTKGGQANRDALRDQASAAIDMGKSVLAAGGSVEDAAGKVTWLRQELINQGVAAGISQADMESYLATLGLTPENITTSIQIANDEAAKARIGDVQKKLDQIDEGAAAEIQALIDKGAWAEAEKKLNELARNRYPLFIPSGNFASGDVAGGKGKSSEGRLVRGGTNFLTTTGEIPGRRGDEVIFPLGDPSRIKELFAMPEVGQRMTAALSGHAGTFAMSAPPDDGGGGSRQITVVIEGRPFTAMLEAHDAAVVNEIMAGAR